MSYPDLNGSVRNRGGAEAEETLRLITRIPAPEGLEDRVRTRLSTAPRKARILAWPEAAGWMRSAAAAAIVFVVAGGGWSIYSRVLPVPPARAIVSPHVGAPGGFSEGGAVRRPQTLQGPLVKDPATPEKLKIKTPPKSVAANGANSSTIPAKRHTQSLAPAAQ